VGTDIGTVGMLLGWHVDLVGRDEPQSGSPLRSLAVIWVFRAGALTEGAWLLVLVPPAKRQVALPLASPDVPAFPTISDGVGLRIAVFGICSTFTARCSPRARQATQGGPLHRRLGSLRYLHDHSHCYRLERQLPGGSISH
jgi:hypothetical protein